MDLDFMKCSFKSILLPVKTFHNPFNTQQMKPGLLFKEVI